MFDLISVFSEEAAANWVKPESVVEFDVFLFVERGELTYCIDDDRLPLTRGDLLYFPAGCSRHAASNGLQGHTKYAVLFRRQSELPALPLLDNGRYSLIRSGSYDYIKQRFSLLIQQWIGKLPYYETVCSGVLLELLGLAQREMESAHVPSKKLSLARRIQDYILTHYREPIRIETLAELVDRTPNYVTKMFREVTGLTPIAYLHQVRVTAARDLLAHTHLSIGQIADRLGFCDQSYFNRVYKKMMGYPPSSHMNEVRGPGRFEQKQDLQP